jgi:hypothetical protein
MMDTFGESPRFRTQITALLPDGLLARLPYCPIALLPYCPTALLPYCLIALLPYCPTAPLPYRLLPYSSDFGKNSASFW